MNKGFLILFLLCCISCGSNYNLNFKNNRSGYERAVKCLNSNYDRILSPDSIKYAISVLHKEDLDKLDSCPGLKLLFNQEPLDYIVIKEDSTIYFYSKPSGGNIRSTQYILLHYNKGTIQNLQLSTDLKLIKEIDTSWYQLERITSLAD
jgi:hypothetical protein